MLVLVLLCRFFSVTMCPWLHALFQLTTTRSQGGPIILVSCLILLLRSGSAYCRASGHRNEDKWWLPVPYVPDAGLTEKVPRDRQQKRDCAANQVPPSPLNNTSVLSDMEVPEGWILHGCAPKVTKASPWSSTQISLAASLSLAGILRLLITGYKRSMNYDACKHKLRCSPEKR